MDSEFEGLACEVLIRKGLRGLSTEKGGGQPGEGNLQYLNYCEVGARSERQVLRDATCASVLES